MSRARAVDLGEKPWIPRVLPKPFAQHLGGLRPPSGSFVEPGEVDVHLHVVESDFDGTLTPGETGFHISLFGRDEKAAIGQNFGLAAAVVDELTK